MLYIFKIWDNKKQMSKSFGFSTSLFFFKDCDEDMESLLVGFHTPKVKQSGGVVLNFSI